jgi:hypothetical protein
MTNSVAADGHSNPTFELLVLAVVMVAMYMCRGAFRFTNDWLNLTFGFVFLLLPFLAFRVALRLRRWAKVLVVALLVSMLALSLLGLSALVIFEIPAAIEHREMSRQLGNVHQGRYSVRLSWDETAGGGLGPHGVNLEQRMTILPGLYTFKNLDWFDEASEGSISAAGTNTIEVHIPRRGGHDEVDRIYTLKPWVYF